MSTPSIRSNADVSRSVPFGLMTVISQPARRRERHIAQTRLSAGTVSFSTMISVLGMVTDRTVCGRQEGRGAITTRRSSGRLHDPMPGDGRRSEPESDSLCSRSLCPPLTVRTLQSGEGPLAPPRGDLVWQRVPDARVGGELRQEPLVKP